MKEFGRVIQVKQIEWYKTAMGNLKQAMATCYFDDIYAVQSSCDRNHQRLYEAAKDFTAAYEAKQQPVPEAGERYRDCCGDEYRVICVVGEDWNGNPVEDPIVVLADKQMENYMKVPLSEFLAPNFRKVE